MNPGFPTPGDPDADRDFIPQPDGLSRSPMSPRLQLKSAYEDGFRFAKLAKEEDQRGNIEPAKMFYIEAVNSFLAAIKLETSDANKKLVAKEIVAYIHRAEEIKTFLSAYCGIAPSAPEFEPGEEPGLPAPLPPSRVPGSSYPASLPSMPPTLSVFPLSGPGTPSLPSIPSGPPSHHSSLSSPPGSPLSFSGSTHSANSSFSACFAPQQPGPGQSYTLPNFPTPCNAPLQPIVPQPQSSFVLPNAPARDEHTRMCQQEMQNADFFLSRAVVSDETGDKKAAAEQYLQAGDYTLALMKKHTSVPLTNPGVEESKKMAGKLKQRLKLILDRAEALKKQQAAEKEDVSMGPAPITISTAVHNRPSPSSSFSGGRVPNRPANMAAHARATSSGANNSRPDPTSGFDPNIDFATQAKIYSMINGKLYYPWSPEDAMQTFTYPIPFSDEGGKLPLSAKQEAALGSWMRPHEFSSQPRMIYMISHMPIKQTLISDCSFVSSLCIAANHFRRFKKQLITNIIYPQDKDGQPVYNPSGKYVVRLVLNGVPRQVIIDDFFPVDKYGQLICSHTTNRGELWVSILEKAYLRVMGGYDWPGSNSGIDLHVLTGWIPERISLHEDFDARAKQRAWERICSGTEYGDCLLTAATGVLDQQTADSVGLVPTHAYAILQVVEVEGKRLLQLKNPWASKRWTGRFSAEDRESWTPALKRALDYDQLSAINVDNGIFWIDYDSLCQYYNVIYLNWNPDLFSHHYKAHSVWSSKSGPISDLVNMESNPQFRLSVAAKQPNYVRKPGEKEKTCSVWLLLSKHVATKKDTEDDFVTLHVYEGKSDPQSRVFYPTDKCIHRGVYINSIHYLVKLDQPINERRDYNLVISQLEKKADLSFTLHVYSQAECLLVQLPNRYTHEVKTTDTQWTERTAGGSPNTPSFYVNPQFRLTTSDACDLLFKLMVPKDVSCNLMIFPGSQKITQSGPGPKPHRGPDGYIGDTGDYRHGFVYVEMRGVPAGDYIIVPSTFNVGHTVPYFLSVGASCGTPRLTEIT